jgi:predicted O-linked N-acetylglucosamine transferase (SPINDLY family)
MNPTMDARLIAADKALSENRRGDAADLLISALEDGVAPNGQIYKVLLHNLFTLKRFAEGAYWGPKALELEPDNYEFHNLLGIFLRRTARYREAIEVLDRAIKLRPGDTSALINKGNICNDLGDGPAAESIFTQLVRMVPRNAEFQRSLGKALWIQRKLDAAAIRMRQAVALQKDNIDAWLDLAGVLADSGKLDASLKQLDKGIAALPDPARLLQAKARMFRRLGKAEQAEQFLNSLRDSMGEAAWYHHEFGRLLSDIDRTKANEHFRRALELEPDDIDHRLALVESLDRTRQGNESGNIEEAYRLLKGARLPAQLTPGHCKVVVEVLTRSGDYEAAENFGSFEDMGRRWASNNMVTALLGHMPRATTAERRRELLHQHRIWGDIAIERARANPIRHPAKPRNSSKIRLGFMSSDLREHPVTYFAWPLFEHADRDRFEIYCYSFYTNEHADQAQQYVQSHVDVFRQHPFIRDRDAAQMIADDQLDILFELGGSTHMNKIEVMAWKPARLCASWLGYPHSAGLSTIDYLLVDPFLNPPDPELLIEKPLIMPQSWIAMSEQAFPDRHVIEPIAPVRRNGHITFGTANNPYKYNVGMLRTWAQVMARVPGSRFLFVRPECGSQLFVENIRARFEAEGIAGDRIEFQSVRGLHMPRYNEIDITLDTFPQTGGTTTCEALWMGVPTITLVGEAVFERLSYSILRNAGLGDLCASSVEEYIDIAVSLAGDEERIQTLRTGLREQLKAGPLGQTRQFAKDFYDLVATTAR